MGEIISVSENTITVQLSNTMKSNMPVIGKMTSKIESELNKTDK